MEGESTGRDWENTGIGRHLGNDVEILCSGNSVILVKSPHNGEYGA